jgi:xanthine dehydrogenase accessory factor
LKDMAETLPSICARWLAEGVPFTLAEIAETQGSAPREKGAVMAVSLLETAGTIGGGQLEWDVIARARKLLVSTLDSEDAALVLGPALGQCCGGRVLIRIKRAQSVDVDVLTAQQDAAQAVRPAVFIYGAGHVGRALARALAPLPLRTMLIDSRAEELAKADIPDITQHLTLAPATIAEQAESNAAHIIMTHSHALDSLIASAVLERGDFRYLGIIGSHTKAASFRSAFRAMDLPEDRIACLICPIGNVGVRDKRPEVIAALAAAEVIGRLLRDFEED